MEKVTVDIQLCQPDPQLLHVLTGGIVGEAPDQGMTVHYTVKRTFWQWLTRKPKERRMIYLPRVEVMPDETP